MAKAKYELSDRAFFEAFRKESDRACAVLGRGLLEEHTRRLLAAFFVDHADHRRLLENQGPAATFSARIKVAEALGLLAPDEASDLNVVRDIGNDFAHGLDHAMSFEEHSIRDRVFAITAPRIFLDYNHLTDKPLPASEIAEFNTIARRRYEVAIGRFGGRSTCSH